MSGSVDNLAHGLLGAAIARSGFQRTLDPRRATWIGVISANVADLDAVEALWSSREAFIYHHRGLTHSLVGLLAGTLLLTLLFRWRWRDLPWRPLLLLTFLGYASHLALDVPTSWGTMLCLPFSKARAALDWVFIVDLMYFLILAAPWWLRRRISEIPVFRGALVVLLLYVATCALAKRVARDTLYLMLDREGVEAHHVEVYPAPFAPIFWNGVAQDAHKSYQVHLALPFVPDAFSHIRAHNLEHPAVAAFRESPEGDRFYWWARSPVATVTVLDDRRVRVELDDLRYASYLAERFGRHTFRYDVVMVRGADGRWSGEAPGRFHTWWSD